jgi:hypothetical protein
VGDGPIGALVPKPWPPPDGLTEVEVVRWPFCCPLPDGTLEVVDADPAPFTSREVIVLLPNNSDLLFFDPTTPPTTAAMITTTTITMMMMMIPFLVT